MKAAIYIRVSTEEQAQHGVSLADQESRLKAYCESKGFDIVAVIRDNGTSGGIPIDKRDGGKKLAKLVDGKKTQHIVSLKLDRLFRDCVDCLNKSREWDSKGIALHLLDMNIDTSTPMGRMFLTMAAGFAELERNLIAERTRSALRHKKASRKAYNHAPLGFERIGNDLVPVEGEMAVVDRIRNLREKGYTLQKIADFLNLEGVSTKNGGKWYASTIKNICENSIYSSVARV